MLCSKCKNTNIDIDHKKIFDLDEEVKIVYFGTCKNCGELVGSVETFKYFDWDYLSNEKAKEIFEKGIDKSDYL